MYGRYSRIAVLFLWELSVDVTPQLQTDERVSGWWIVSSCSDARVLYSVQSEGLNSFLLTVCGKAAWA
jgi:hypothetical protein